MKVHETFSNIDKIRFGHQNEKQRDYVRLRPAQRKTLLKYNRELERMYDSYRKTERGGNHDKDKPQLRKEALDFLQESKLVYRGSTTAYVINPYLSLDIKPTVYRVLKRTLNSDGVLV